MTMKFIDKACTNGRAPPLAGVPLVIVERFMARISGNRKGYRSDLLAKQVALPKCAESTGTLRRGQAEIGSFLTRVEQPGGGEGCRHPSPVAIAA